MNKELAVVVPVYNEAQALKSTLEKWITALSKLGISYRVFAINDGSADNTGDVLGELAKTHPSIQAINKRNEGHGKTILKGYKMAIEERYAWIFQVDSDDQFFPEDFERLWGKRQDSDFILGHREKRSDPLARLIITRILRFLILVLWGIKIRDANNPYRLMRGNFLKELIQGMPIGIFAPNIFLSILACKKGRERFLEVPVRHRERYSGSCSIRSVRLIKSTIRSFWELLCFRFRRDK